MLRRFLLTIVSIFLFTIYVNATPVKYFNYASKGGKQVKVSASTIYKLMETYPQCTVSIFNTGTSTLATIYSDSGGTPKANPFIADSDAAFFFYVEPGIYDIRFSGTGIDIPFTWGAININTSGGGGGSGITTLNGLTGTTQTFATGSSGGDFNISSSGIVHTFNIPTASNSNRGLLSTTDWINFNAKQGNLVNSAGLMAALNDETGFGLAVFNNSPTFINPTLGNALVSSLNGLGITSTAGAILNILTNKTFTVNKTLTLEAAGDGFTFTIPATGTAVLTSRTITEGVGLAGNTYDLSANRTLALGTPSTLTVSSVNSVSGTTHSHAITSSANPGASASLLASSADGYLQLVRLGVGVAPTQAIETNGNIFINSSTANLFMKDINTGWQVSTTQIINPQSNNSIRATNYTSGLVGWNINALGDAEFNNVDVRGAIRSSIFMYNAIMATAGTLGIFKSAASLRNNVVIPAGPTYGSTTVAVDVDDPEGLSHAQIFAAGDILRLKDGLVGDTWLVVNSAADQTTFWRYTCTIMAGTNNVTYRAGMGVPDYGVSGNGFIIQTADQTNAPYLQMATHLATFSSSDANGTLLFTPQLRLGNLNGSYGFATNTYGLGAGTYGVSGKSWIIAEPSIGVRLGSNTTTRIQLSPDGSGFLANNNIVWDTSGNATIAGWTINSNRITSGVVNIASSFDVPAGATAWFGQSVAGYRGTAIRDASGRNILMFANDGTIFPYIHMFDGTRARVVIGGLNNAWNADGSTNSMGMKIWDSSGNLLVHFSDVANTISGWTITTTRLSAGSAATTVGLDTTATGGDDIRIFAGDSTPSSAPFRVTEAGVLTSTNANITGTITATAGSLSGLSVTGLLTMSGASSSIAIGTTPPTSCTSGTGIFIDRNAICSVTAGVSTAKMDALGFNVPLTSTTTNSILFQHITTSENIMELKARRNATAVGSDGELFTQGNNTDSDSKMQLWTREFGGATEAHLSQYSTPSTAYMTMFGTGLVGLKIGADSAPSITGTGATLHVTGNTIRIENSRTPASASASCNAGEIAWDSGFVYVCVAANTWKRSAITTW